MSTSTQNYGFTKPDPNEYYDVGVFNQNFDDIDAAIKEAANSGGGVIKGESTSEDTNGTMVVTFDEAILEKFGSGEIADGTTFLIKFVNGWHPYNKIGTNARMYFNINNSNYPVYMDNHNSRECGIEVEKNGILTMVFNSNESNESFSFVSSSSNSTPSIITETNTANTTFNILFQVSSCRARTAYTSAKLTFNPNTGFLTLNGSMSVSGTLSTNNLTLNSTLTAETVIANTYKSKDITRASNVSMATYPGKAWDIYLGESTIGNRERGMNIRRQFNDGATRVRLFSVTIKLTGSSAIVSESSCAPIDIESYIDSHTYFKSTIGYGESVVDAGLPVLYGGSRVYPVLSQEAGNIAVIGDAPNYNTITRGIRYEYYDNGTRASSKSSQVPNNFTVLRFGDKDVIDHVMVESRNCITFQTYPPMESDSDYSTRKHPDRTQEGLYSYIAFSIHGGLSSKPVRQAERSNANNAQMVLRSSCATFRYPIDKISIQTSKDYGSEYHDLAWFIPKKTVITIAHAGTDYSGDYTAYDTSGSGHKTLDQIINDHLTNLDELSKQNRLVHFLIYPGTYVVSDTIHIFRENTIIEGLDWGAILVTPDSESTNGKPIFNIDDKIIESVTYMPKNIFIRNLTLKHGGEKDMSHTNGCLIKGDTTGSGLENFYTIENVFFSLNEDHQNGSSTSTSGTTYNNNASAIYMGRVENVRILNCWFTANGSSDAVCDTSSVVYLNDWANQGGFMFNNNIARCNTINNKSFKTHIITPAGSNGYSFNGNVGLTLLTSS